MNQANARLDQARAAYRAGDTRQTKKYLKQILSKAPEHPGALCLAGQVYADAGQTGTAIKRYKSAIAAAPDDVEAYVCLGDLVGKAALRHPDDAGIATEPPRDEETLNLLEQAEQRFPGRGDITLVQGYVSLIRGDDETATARFQEALRLDPSLHTAPISVAAHLHLASGYAAENIHDKTAYHFSQARLLAPSDSRVYVEYARALISMGHVDEAKKHLMEGLKQADDPATLHYLLGDTFLKERNAAAAEEHVTRFARLRRKSPEALLMQGLLAFGQKRLTDSKKYFESALEINPNHPHVLWYLADTLFALAENDRAAEIGERARTLMSNNQVLDDAYLFGLCYSSRSATEIGRERITWGENYLRRHPPPPFFHDNDPDPERRLRVGYISNDLVNHPVGWFMLPLFEHHNPAVVAVFAYSNAARQDAMSARLQDHTFAWHNIRDMSARQVADRIRADRIDLLVDLSGHTAKNRLDVLACKPSPVQISYLGDAATTGLSTVDWRITDSIVDPEGAEDAYSERLHRLDPPFFCYAPRAEEDSMAAATRSSFPSAGPVRPLPAASNGYITFGSLINPIKLNKRILTLWGRVLEEVPGSRLYMFRDTFGDPGTRAHFLAMFKACGIPPERIDLDTEPVSQGSHLVRYGHMDICLDTLPFCGHATTCEALWMGVPTISRIGDSFAGRMGASLLGAAGLDEWVAHSDEEFVAIARRMAEDPERLGQLRASLRKKVRVSALCDGAGFTRRMEQAYRTLWQAWCAEQR
ncbi:MAG: tetratricopeptide repeat protein [Leptospirillia bacterium]